MSRFTAIISLLLGLFVIGGMTCSSSTAASIKEDKKRLRRVAVLPVMNFIRTPQSLWQQPQSAGKTTEAVIQSYLVRRLRIEPKLEVISPKQVLERITSTPSNAGKIDLGENRMELGMDFFRSLQVKKAIPHLRQARAALEDAYYGILAPEKMATLLLTLGQCYLEQKDTHRAHVMLKEMFFRAPRRHFKKGFYAGSIEQALMSALVDFVATYPKENPLPSMAALERFVTEIDVDSLVFTYLESSRSGPRLRLVVYDRHTRNVSYRGSMVTADSAADLERVDRFVSRWVACLPAQVGGPKMVKKGVSKFFVDTVFAYSLFLKDPTRRNFHNLGMGIATEWQFSNSLGIFGQLNMFTSVQDPDRDLLEQVSSVRFVAGLSYALGSKWWRLYARLGFDVHIPGSFTITKDPGCKFYGVGDKEDCKGDVFELGGETTMGPIASLGAQFFFARGLYATVRATGSTYIIPLDRSAALNHPFGFETGIGYTF